MRLAYFDCFSGISGDMALGALIHAGADLDRVTELLETLPMGGFHIEREETEDHGIWATKLHVKVEPQGLIRTYSSVRQMIASAELSAQARRLADRVFHRLATALAAVHGKEPDVVTFHELGEIECLVEVVGSAIALDLLGVERIFASAIPTGMGMVRHEHGIVPVPSAEVVELLQAVPTYTRGIPVELVTPVGAAIVAALVEGFGDMPMMRADHVGYGAGHPRLDFPNVLRVVIGEEERSRPAGAAGAGSGSAELFVPGSDEAPDLPAGWRRLAAVPEPEEPPDALIEATAADPGPRGRGEVIEAMLEAGATDAWLTPVVRPGGERGVLVSALGPAEAQETLVDRLRALPGAGPVRLTPAWRAP